MYKERAGHVEFGTAVYRACAPLVDWRYLCVYVLVYITRTHIAGIHVVHTPAHLFTMTVPGWKVYFLRNKKCLLVLLLYYKILLVVICCGTTGNSLLSCRSVSIWWAPTDSTNEIVKKYDQILLLDWSTSIVVAPGVFTLVLFIVYF